MSKKILGSNFILYLQRGAKNYALCCGKDLEISINSEVKELTNNPNSRWRTYRQGFIGYNVTFSALYDIISGDSIGGSELFDRIKNGDIIEFVCSNGEDANIFYTGKILFNNMGISGNVGSLVEYNMTAVGCGELYRTSRTLYKFLEDGEGNYILDGDGHLISVDYVAGIDYEVVFDTNC